ncbi:hypothetical protein [Sulfurimonas sp.]
MKEKVQKVLDTWHSYFSDEKKQYSEYEPSDIEYFVGCMLYNHFAFTKAHHNLKTMDLSYDFLSACGDEYEINKAIIESIVLKNEEEKLAFLQEYIVESKAKYTKPELYLLDRLQYHVNAMAERYKRGVDVEYIDFENPLMRK